MKTESFNPAESLCVDIRTAARLLGVCEKTVRNLTKRGELPVVRIMGRVLYRREDLEDFVRRLSRVDNPLVCVG